MLDLDSISIRLDGACGGVHWRETEMLEPLATFRKEVAMLMARMVGFPVGSQSAM